MDSITLNAIFNKNNNKLTIDDHKKIKNKNLSSFSSPLFAFVQNE